MWLTRGPSCGAGRWIQVCEGCTCPTVQLGPTGASVETWRESSTVVRGEEEVWAAALWAARSEEKQVRKRSFSLSLSLTIWLYFNWWSFKFIFCKLSLFCLWQWSVGHLPALPQPTSFFVSFSLLSCWGESSWVDGLPGSPHHKLFEVGL